MGLGALILQPRGDYNHTAPKRGSCHGANHAKSHPDGCRLRRRRPAGSCPRREVSAGSHEGRRGPVDDRTFQLGEVGGGRPGWDRQPDYARDAQGRGGAGARRRQRIDGAGCRSAEGRLDGRAAARHGRRPSPGRRQPSAGGRRSGPGSAPGGAPAGAPPARGNAPAVAGVPPTGRGAGRRHGGPPHLDPHQPASRAGAARPGVLRGGHHRGFLPRQQHHPPRRAQPHVLQGQGLQRVSADAVTPTGARAKTTSCR